MGVVGVDDDMSFLWDNAHEMMKLGFDLVKVAENISVVKFKIIEHRNIRCIVDEFRTFIEKSSVIFIRFDNKCLAIAYAC